MVPVKKHVVESPVQAIEASLKELLPGVDTNVVFTLCDNEYIKMLNFKYRKKDSETDVLSFPLLMSDIPGKVSYTPLDMDPDTQELILGDIIISIEKAKQQAEEYGHSLERELSYLAVHSVLHLIGYDHMADTDKKKMREKEEEIMTMLGLER
jgi:probable rRNA maturation factor